MKTIFASIILLSCLSFTVLAQNPVTGTKTVPMVPSGQMPSISSVLTELETGITPESFSSAFKSDDWTKEVAALKPTDITGASSLLGQLGSGLNPVSLVKGFSAKEWMSKLKSATTMSSVASEAETLVKNINPSAFKSGFDVSKITSSLNMLKGVK